MLRSVIVAALFACLSWQVAFAQSPPAPSRWKNDRGSILEITSVDAQGAIKGQFTNNAAGYKCIGTPYDIVGHSLKTGFFFATTFPPCYSFASWRGEVRGNSITMSYVLSWVDPEDGVVATIGGIDTFTSVP